MKPVSLAGPRGDGKGQRGETPYGTTDRGRSKYLNMFVSVAKLHRLLAVRSTFDVCIYIHTYRHIYI